MKPTLDVTEAGVRVVTVDPGNASRYTIVLARIPDAACGALSCDKDSLLVTIPNHNTRPLILQPDTYASPSYIHEKLGVTWGDAEVLAPIFQALTDPSASAA